MFEITEENKNKYVICSLERGYAYNSLIFWGKNSCGYYPQLEECEVYTKEEALQHATPDDIPIKVSELAPYLATHVEHAYEVLKQAKRNYDNGKI